MAKTKNLVLSKTFDETFQHNILASEQKRSILLMIVFFMVTLLMLSIYISLEELFPQQLHQKFPWIILTVFLGGCYEIWVLAVIQFFLQRNKKFPYPARLITITVEVTVISIILYQFSIFLDPISGILSPPGNAYFVLILLAILRLDFFLCAFTGALAMLESNFLAWYFKDQIESMNSMANIYFLPSHYPFIYIKGGVLIVAGLLAGYVSKEIKNKVIKSLEMINERNEIVDMFGKHVSPHIAAKLIDQTHDQEGELQEITVMFLDIRGFTQFSEQHTPHEVVAFLNRCFTDMIDIVGQHQGIINKFLGDGFMAFFGVPQEDPKSCQNAVLAALQMRNNLTEQIKNKHLPAIQIGIGIHHGEAMTGLVGSPQRREFTVIGDTVNLASRIEQLNKTLETQILISDSVKNSLPGEIFALKEWPSMNVKGRQQSVNIFEVLEAR